MNEKQETWENVSNYEGLYKVSSLGRIESVSRIVESSRAKPYRIKGRVLRVDSSKPYGTVQLSRKGSKSRFYIHRLVAQAFIPNPEGKSQVNHINGIKTDNRVVNLEWATALENNRHAIFTGLVDLRGENNPLTSLIESQVLSICSMLDSPTKEFTHEYISNKFNIHADTVNNIGQGHTWNWLTNRKTK